MSRERDAGASREDSGDPGALQAVTAGPLQRAAVNTAGVVGFKQVQKQLKDCEEDESTESF